MQFAAGKLSWGTFTAGFEPLRIVFPIPEYRYNSGAVPTKPSDLILKVYVQAGK